MSRPFDVIDLGRRDYGPVLQMQKDLVAGRQRGVGRDTLILVEHEPVYTLGRNADASNVLLPAEELERRGIEVVQIGRGGDVTYHGPGQLVGYPIIALKALGQGVVWYVGRLEETILGTLRDFGIRGGTDGRHRGVWIGEKKIAALGVRVTRGVTMHGFALNVHMDLSHYEGIVPCGIGDKGVTSMHMLLSAVLMDDVKKRIIEHFGAIVYGYRGTQPAGGAV